MGRMRFAVVAAVSVLTLCAQQSTRLADVRKVFIGTVATNDRSEEFVRQAFAARLIATKQFEVVEDEAEADAVLSASQVVREEDRTTVRGRRNTWNTQVDGQEETVQYVATTAKLVGRGKRVLWAAVVQGGVGSCVKQLMKDLKENRKAKSD